MGSPCLSTAWIGMSPLLKTREVVEVVGLSAPSVRLKLCTNILVARRSFWLNSNLLIAVGRAAMVDPKSMQCLIWLGEASTLLPPTLTEQKAVRARRELPRE